MKHSRQEKILELISQYDISTQEELTSKLNELGYKTTQATVSRDIHSLQLKKVPSSQGQKYAAPGNAISPRDRYLRIFSEGLVSVEQAVNLVVIKTTPGMAMASAAALDGLKPPELVGSIAGDDTIMCACRSDYDAKELAGRIKQLLENER